MQQQDGETLSLQLPFPVKHYSQGFDEMTPAVAEMLKDIGVKVIRSRWISARCCKR